MREKVYQWKKGISLSFFLEMEYEKEYEMRKESINACKDVLRSVKDHGFDCVELSFSHEDYFEKFHFTEEGIAEGWREYCNSLGLELWSIHLPFSEKLDLSREDAAEALRDDIALVEAAGRAGISVAVIHPSFEPVMYGEREWRLEYAKKNLAILNRKAKENGVILALENLPRTCLGNRSGELVQLLEDTGASFIFDTNHSLEEDNVLFLQNMIQSGNCPVSLHISDYDLLDERHDLPGTGINPWRKLLGMLESGGYQGPAMYEIRPVISPGRRISLEELTENINRLLAGEIP